MYTLIVTRKSGKVAFPVNSCDLLSALEEFKKAQEDKFYEITKCKHFSLSPIISAELVETFRNFD